jgi:hypothetical protein
MLFKYTHILYLEPPGGLKAWPSQKDLEDDGKGRSHGSVEDME